MRLSRRSSRLAPGSALLIGLLLLMLGLSSVLGYQAMDAARAEARSTDRALRGYAEVARWELSRRGDAVMAERLITAAVEGGTALRAAEARGDGGLRALSLAAQGAFAWCGCPEAVRAVFRVDATEDGRLAVTGPGLAPEVRARLESFEWQPVPARLVQARIRGGDTVMMQPAAGADSRDVLVYQVRAVQGSTLRGYGMLVDARRVAGPALREVLDGVPLLPQPVGSGLTNRQAVSVVLTAPGGDEVFRFPAPPSRDAAWVDAKVGTVGMDAVPRGAVSGRMNGVLAPLTVRVSVHPSLAAGRGGDGAPESRLPLLMAVFGLTLALFGIAVVQLRRQQELVRLRDDFVSGVSHELRTPLAQIRLFADLLESGRLGDPAQRARSVRIINEESRRLTYLVENILHFSRSQRDANRLSPLPVDVGALVREVVDGFAPLARDVDFATQLEPGVVARIDHDAFRQVLLNLLDNAAKYGPRGGVVQVGMAVVGFNLRIWVRDHGPGVPREERLRIWEPYRRLDREADASVGGSGIGLAVVRDVVELHGGRVWVENAPGGGARFVVQIPGATYAGPPGEEDEPAASTQPAEAVAQ